MPSFRVELGKTPHFRGLRRLVRGPGLGFAALSLDFHGTVGSWTISGRDRQRPKSGREGESIGALARRTSSLREAAKFTPRAFLAGKDHWNPIAEAAKLP